LVRPFLLAASMRRWSQRSIQGVSSMNFWNVALPPFDRSSSVSWCRRASAPGWNQPRFLFFLRPRLEPFVTASSPAYAAVEETIFDRAVSVSKRV
jgi:hypothetical protein